MSSGSKKAVVLLSITLGILIVATGVVAVLLFTKADNKSADSESVSKYVITKETTSDVVATNESTSKEQATQSKNITTNVVVGKANMEKTPITTFNKLNASSTFPDEGDNNYSVENVQIVDSFCWVENAEGVGVGEYIRMEADQEVEVKGIAIKNGGIKNKQFFENNGKVTTATITFSDGSSTKADLYVPSTSDDFDVIQYVEFSSPVKTKSIKVTIDAAISGIKFTDTCISYCMPY